MAASVTYLLVSPDSRRCLHIVGDSSEEVGQIPLTPVLTLDQTKLGESVKPCGRTIHLCCFVYVWGSSHSKTKMPLLSSARGQAQNASFRSTMLNHW
jgi:hypothetical protein